MLEFVLIVLGGYLLFNLRSIHIDFGGHRDSLQSMKPEKEEPSEPRKPVPENTVPRKPRL